ncbi:MAG: hypothetical protein M0R68_15730 [Bacteroidetes bacterium]|nr:hypothetical protein [Bacteroidota bacterium]
MLIKDQPAKVQPTKKWLGPQDRCDICSTPFDMIPWFADARLRTGCWAIVCPDCNRDFTCGKFGPGFGQKYDAKTKIKLEG